MVVIRVENAVVAVARNVFGRGVVIEVVGSGRTSGGASSNGDSSISSTIMVVVAFAGHEVVVVLGVVLLLVGGDGSAVVVREEVVLDLVVLNSMSTSLNPSSMSLPRSSSSTVVPIWSIVSPRFLAISSTSACSSSFLSSLSSEPIGPCILFRTTGMARSSSVLTALFSVLSIFRSGVETVAFTSTMFAGPSSIFSSALFSSMNSRVSRSKSFVITTGFVCVPGPP